MFASVMVFCRRGAFGVLLLAMLLLSGCVRDRVGITFEGLHRGAIVQHVEIGEQLSNFSLASARSWLESIERRAKSLGGRVDRRRDSEIVVTIPFGSAPDLAEKFDRFFAATLPDAGRQPAADPVQFHAQMEVFQSNLLLFQRTRLRVTIDLRALRFFASNGKAVVEPSSLLDLAFELQTPWGATPLPSASSLSPLEKEGAEGRMKWQLQPGQVNQIEVAFWLPEPLGLGAIAIVALVAIGYAFGPERRERSTSNATPDEQSS